MGAGRHGEGKGLKRRKGACGSLLGEKTEARRAEADEERVGGGVAGGGATMDGAGKARAGDGLEAQVQAGSRLGVAGSPRLPNVSPTLPPSFT